MIPNANGDYCEVVEARLSPGDCEAAKRLYGKTVEGRPSANVPSVMYTGEPTQVTLAIGMPGEGEAAAARAVEGGAGDPVTFRPGKIGPRMQAELVGAGFSIKLLSPSSPIQDVPAHGATSWTWEVVPKAAGRRQLRLKTAVVFVDEAEKEHALSRTEETYDVQVTVRPVATSFWTRLLDTLNRTPDVLKAITAVVAGATSLLVAVVGLRTAWNKTRGG